MKRTTIDGGGELGHQQTWELIPWLVNGTLDAAEMRQVEAHLDGCSICREEERTSRRLAAAVREMAELEAAPALPERGFDALMSRIDAAEGAASAAPDAGVAAERPSRAPRLRRWLAGLGEALTATPVGVRAALAVQLAVILLFAGFLLGRRPTAPPPAPAVFETLSDPRGETPAPPGRLLLRVVFADDAGLGEVRELLAGLGAEIVGGPSPTGVYTLELGERSALERSVVERLRGRSEVVFAEPVLRPAPAEER